MAIEIPNGLTTKQFFTEFVPKQFKETTSAMELSKYAGITETAVVELTGSDEAYSFTVNVNNNADLTVKEGKTDSAIAFVEIAANLVNDFLAKKLPKLVQDELNENLANPGIWIQKFTDMEPADVKKKLVIVKGINGKVSAKVNADGVNFEGSVRFNNAQSPQFAVVGKFQDIVKLAKGELNPIQGFMSGAFKIEGDMALAMRLQPLIP